MWMPAVRCSSHLETPNGAIHMTQNAFCRVIFPKIPIGICQNIVQINQAICPAVTDSKCQKKDLALPGSAKFIQLMGPLSFYQRRTHGAKDTPTSLKSLKIHPAMNISQLVLVDPQMHLKRLIIPVSAIADLASGILRQIFYIIL